MTLQSSGRRIRGSDPIAARIRALAPWFHNLHLPSGRETAPDHPLGDFPSFKWRQLAAALPQDLRGRVRFERLTVYDLARRSERFDLVLFMGVLYHLRHPLLALDALAEKAKRLRVVERPGHEIYVCVPDPAPPKIRRLVREELDAASGRS